ncbi:MAG TPA: uracil-DNA glycosylase, partial [Ruminococcaceae bacterium]|nr:uracil-DNA glycosylase [Oscillospiraceae bacterium]
MPQSWEDLEAECKACTACGLAAERTHVVFGVGDPQAEVMFIGEGPGQQEDLRGEPFVGRAGQLLDKMLLAVGLDRKRIYIANIVKCRPPKNRDPLPEEQAACLNWLREQTRRISPKIIVCLGRIAGMKLMKPDLKITKEHGQWFKRGHIWMMATLHPAALLRNPRQQPDAFQDY